MYIFLVMWSNLLVLHSEDKGRDSESFEGLHFWKTCMRSLYVGDIRIFDVNYAKHSRHYKIYIGYDAYKVLLEIISGIRSRLLGETEVLAQFKEIFKNEALPKNALGDYLMKLRDQLIEDSRKIRSKYLRHLGDQSYGGLAHRYLKNTSEVTMIGSGQLAEKVLPWLLENNRKVKVTARNIEKLNEFSGKHKVVTEHLQEFSPAGEAIVIAAPISISEIIPSIDRNAIIVDFRENDCQDNFSSHPNYISFAAMLNALKEQESRTQALRKTLQVVVAEIAQEREQESQNFIYCWEDVHCYAY